MAKLRSISEETVTITNRYSLGEHLGESFASLGESSSDYMLLIGFYSLYSAFVHLALYQNDSTHP